MTQPITDHAAFLGEARQAMETLNRIKKDYSQLELEEKQLDKQLDGERKAVDDLVSLTVKKRREEVNSSYDKQIAKGQERLKRAKAKREKAKNQGMKDRIMEETASLREENRQMALKLKSLFQAERVPSFCRRSWYYALYMPRTLKEIGILLLVILVCFAAVPWGAYLLIPAQDRHSWMLIFIYLADILLLGGVYFTLGNHTKMGNPEVIRQGREIRNVIHSNKKKIRAVTKAIRRDRNEAIYNLEKFDDEISRTNQELAELTAKKQEALNTFDTVTQTIISDEIIRSSKDKIDQLTQSHERMEERLKDLGQQVQEKSLELTEKYEIYVGKEFMQPEKLAELARLIRSGQAAKITEAISRYKIGK